MSISLSTTQKQIEAHLPHSVRPSSMQDVPWTRTVAAGALIAGVCLLLGGKRKAGVAVAAAGTLFGLAEEPEAIKEWCETLPRHVKTAQQFLAKVEGVVEQLSAQGENIRRLIRR